MFLDWPVQKREVRENLSRAAQRLTLAGAPVVTQVPRVDLREGSQVVFVEPDGTRKEMTPVSHQFSVTFRPEELSGGGPEPLARAAQELGASMARDMETGLIETLRGASEKNAFLFHGKSPEEIGEQMLNGLDALDFSFEDDGKPSIVMIADPQAAAYLSHLANDPELERRFGEVVERKRREWIRRESYRRLVD